jgi:serine/threonine protein kinase
MTPWSAGTQIGPYLLISAIGAGGMGEVWKARDTRLDRIVAVKRLHGQHSARFELEARANRYGRVPHVVPPSSTQLPIGSSRPSSIVRL